MYVQGGGNRMIQKGAEPFFIPGGPHGVLLLHALAGDICYTARV